MVIKISKIFKLVVNLILIILIFFGFLAAFSLLPIPRNYKIFTVQSGSMEPVIPTGSLIIIKPYESYEIGDIVTRKTSEAKTFVTHRIISKKEKEGKIIFETKGDANSAPDMEKVYPEDILGKKILSIPLLGYPVSYAKTTQGLILLVIIPAVIIIYDEINKIKREMKVWLKRRKSNNKVNAKKNEKV